MALPNELTASAAGAQIRAGKLKPSELAEACLAQAAAREPSVKSFVHLDADAVRKAATAADASNPGIAAPIHGVPVGFKDIIDTSDMPTCYNSPIYAGHQPKTDASVVALTRVAGGIVFGKTVTTEFANRAPGPTTNPHDATRTPGGSSSGSAAAVAAKIVPLALGTQTSGSVIRPASYCGVHGFKGSWGEISYAGVKLTSGTLDTIGIYARSLADIALYRAVLTGVRPLALQVGNIGVPRIGLYRSPFRDQADPSVMAMLEDVAAACARAGARVSEVDLPGDFTRLNEMQRWVSSYEGARSLAWEKSFHRDKLSPDLRDARIADGEACSAELYRSACRAGEASRIAFDGIMAEWDVLLTPASPGEAPVGLAYTGAATFNTMWTLLHTPCVTIPGHTGPNGMPVGFQLVGPRGSDHRLLEVASWIERAAFR